MLILQHRLGESIWIGENIKITVLGHTKEMTRIGIEAPLELPIVRKESRSRERLYENP